MFIWVLITQQWDSGLITSADKTQRSHLFIHPEKVAVVCYKLDDLWCEFFAYVFFIITFNSKYRKKAFPPNLSVYPKVLSVSVNFSYNVVHEKDKNFIWILFVPGIIIESQAENERLICMKHNKEWHLINISEYWMWLSNFRTITLECMFSQSRLKKEVYPVLGRLAVLPLWHFIKSIKLSLHAVVILTLQMQTSELFYFHYVKIISQTGKF